MYATIVKKFMGLLAVYAVLIVGIFVLQLKWPAPTFAKKETKKSAPRNVSRAAHSVKPVKSAKPAAKTARAPAKPAKPAAKAPAQVLPPPFAFSAMTAQNSPLPQSITSLSSAEVYNNTLTQIESALISSFNVAGTTSIEDITEADAVAFVAASAKTMNLADAITRVPPQIKHASYRTYLSAPYFGSLSSTYRLLEAALASCNNTLATVNGNSESAIAALGMERMTDYILMNPTQANVTAMLKAVGSAQTLSVEEAASVLLSYCALNERAAGVSSPADMLQGILPKCFAAIESHITTDGDTLSVTDVENAQSAVRVAAALVKAGEATGNTAAAATGRALVNAYVKTASDVPLAELSELEVLLLSPPHYPHLVPLGNGIYAFTCADSVKYTPTTGGANIEITAQGVGTHYVIVSGIKPFAEIYIYNMPYHADQRFETYNSSGYVYVPATNTLLLKNRHKAASETIRLVYRAQSAGGQ